MRTQLLTLLLFLCCLHISPAFADEEIPDALDFDRRHAISTRFELSPYGGDYVGDKLSHTFIVGGNLQYNLTETLGVNADFGYSEIGVDKASGLGKTFTTNNEYLADGGFVITVPAAYRSRKGYTEADFYSSIGGGILRINNSNRGGGYVGGGMKVRLKKFPWLAIRVDIRNYFTSIPNPDGSNFEDDVTIRVGPTFLLPPEF